MSVNWPSSPIDGQEYTEAGQTWVYTSPPNVWKAKAASSGIPDQGTNYTYHDPDRRASYSIIGTTLECWGFLPLTQLSSSTLTFPATFIREPAVMLGLKTPNASGGTLWTTAVSETTLTLRASYAGGNNPDGAGWHAKGQWDGITPTPPTDTLIIRQTLTNANTTWVPMPSDIEAGDIIIVMQGVGSSDSIAAAYGTGFTAAGTELQTYTTDKYRSCMSFKIADGSEAGQSIGGFMIGGTRRNVIYVLRPVGGTVSTVTAGTNVGHDTSLTVPSSLVPSADTAVVISASWENTNAVNFSSGVPIQQSISYYGLQGSIGFSKSGPHSDTRVTTSAWASGRLNANYLKVVWLPQADQQPVDPDALVINPLA